MSAFYFGFYFSPLSASTIRMIQIRENGEEHCKTIQQNEKESA